MVNLLAESWQRLRAGGFAVDSISTQSIDAAALRRFAQQHPSLRVEAERIANQVEVNPLSAQWLRSLRPAHHAPAHMSAAEAFSFCRRFAASRDGSGIPRLWPLDTPSRMLRVRDQIWVRLPIENPKIFSDRNVWAEFVIDANTHEVLEVRDRNARSLRTERVFYALQE